MERIFVMGYSVELLFDKSSEEKIKSYWKLLHDEGGGDFMHLKGGRPHISLAVYYSEMEDIKKLREIVQSIFSQIKKFDLIFNSIGVFPGEERVTFLSPKPSVRLLSIQSALYNEIRRQGIRKYYWGHYKPKIWVPHCTMILNNEIDMHIKGIEILSRDFQAMEVTIERVALVEFYPFNTILEMELI
ncbi:MAG TPA: hypothetical protein DCG34_06880 [Clostridiales bacterium]|jgi:2'-5' RNA ligase|nr:hypothetical protein [Clostridiales bacterium]